MSLTAAELLATLAEATEIRAVGNMPTRQKSAGITPEEKKLQALLEAKKVKTILVHDEEAVSFITRPGILIVPTSLVGKTPLITDVTTLLKDGYTFEKVEERRYVIKVGENNLLLAWEKNKERTPKETPVPEVPENPAEGDLFELGEDQIPEL